MNPISHPWILIAAILAFGLVYVVLPVVGLTFRRYRPPQLLTCPETGERVGLFVDARRAAFTAAVGAPSLKVVQCSLWPQRKDCGQRCLKRG